MDGLLLCGNPSYGRGRRGMLTRVGTSSERASGGAVTGVLCVRCLRQARTGLDGPCPVCGPEGVHEVQFDLRAAARTLTRASLARRPLDMWRYRELLPLPEG